MAEIRWTEESAQWLRDIHDYIAADNPGAAATVVASIYEKVQLLREQPEIVTGTKPFLVATSGYFSTDTTG